MKKLISSVIGGIAGAVALNVLHQTAQRYNHDAPRVDLVGKEALNKGLKKVGVQPLTGKSLLTATFAADVVSNSAYYSMVGLGKRKNLIYHGIAHGLCVGFGALTLTKPLGLSDAPVKKTKQTKLMTVAWYTFGGLVAGLTMQALRED